MKTVLTTGLTPERSKQVRDEFQHSPAFRERLISVLNGKKDSLRSECIAKTSYDTPSWPYLQADCNGYERAIKEIISLLESKNDDF